ncbi:MAG: hypothetical protein ACP5PT_04615 [Brevinematia bacterium]
MIPIEHLESPKRFKEKLSDYISHLKDKIINKYYIDFDTEELGDLVLSICRSNDFELIHSKGKNKFLDEDKFWDWIEKKLIPNTIIVGLDDPEIIRLLIFCLEMTFKMFEGGTKATVTQKGFRERKRTFESILVDQFTGKLGEVILKKFLEKYFPVDIELDWKISLDMKSFKKDIINAKKIVSVKTSPNLSGIWAEADIGYDYGIMIKCSIPSGPILQFFIEVCGFSKLLDFASEKLAKHDDIFKNYLDELKKRIKAYKCGEIKTSLKGFVCGYFKTSEYTPTEKGEKLPYLGEVREKRYLVSIKELKWTKEDWKNFLIDNRLLT